MSTLQRQRQSVLYVIFLALAWALFGAVSAITAPQANAEGPWAAISWSFPEGVSGTGDGSTQDAAKSEALTVCANNGGTACEVFTSTSSGCIAIAVNGPKISGGNGPTLDAARSSALSSNAGATVKQAMCADSAAAPPPQQPPPQQAPPQQKAPPTASAGPTLSWTPRPGSLMVHVTDKSGTSSVCTYTADWFRSLPFPLRANGTFDLLITPSVPENRTWNVTVRCDNGTSTQTTHFY